jgi:hypothetical protein
MIAKSGAPLIEPFAGQGQHVCTRFGSVFDRMWWLLTGTLLGGVVTARALRRKPHPRDLSQAAAETGADILDLAARAIRPPRR